MTTGRDSLTVRRFSSTSVDETVRESLILVKNISKFLTVQTAGVNVDVKEVGPDVVTIAAKMDIAAIKMDAGHALGKWHNF